MTAAAPSRTAPSPTAILSAEHRVLERVLACLDRMADAYEAAGAVDAAEVARAVDFLRTFADRCHHGKEEANLFPALERLGIPADAGPTAVMRAEHETGRGLVREMADAAADGALPRFAAAAREYAAFLREHIQKEDQVLFPMADRMLSPAEQDALLQAFGRVEHLDLGPGTHERMIGIAEALCAKYGVPAVSAPVAGSCGACCGHRAPTSR
jgi:hemerythrin-like domain-containing protein